MVKRSASVYLSPPSDRVTEATMSKVGDYKYEVLLTFQYSRKMIATAFLNDKGGWKIEAADGEAKLKEAKNYRSGTKIPPSLQERLEEVGVYFV